MKSTKIDKMLKNLHFALLAKQGRIKAKLSLILRLIIELPENFRLFSSGPFSGIGQHHDTAPTLIRSSSYMYRPTRWAY
jgi:hypothetical protein